MFNKTAKNVSKKVFSFVVLMVFSFANLFVLATNNGTELSRQPAVQADYLNFQATYQNGVVNMSWNHFTLPSGDNWTYWKVMRSTTNPNPVYKNPGDNYIKYSSDMNFTSYTDNNPPQGTVYYRVCAITSSSRGRHRYCSNVVALNINGSSQPVVQPQPAPTPAPTPAPVVQPTELSDAMKGMIDTLVVDFAENLDDKFGDDLAAKEAYLTQLIPAIDAVSATSSDNMKPVFAYLTVKIEELKAAVQLQKLLNVE